MQLTIDSSESLDRVLTVVGSLYGVTLTTANGESAATEPSASSAPARGRGGRRVAAKSAAKPAKAAKSGTDLSALRQWAEENGHRVSARGPVPAAVRQAYAEATATPRGRKRG